MGYTHYFPQSRSFKNDEWKTAKDGVKKIVEYCQKQGIALQYEYNISKKPSITSEVIRFNGVGDDWRLVTEIPTFWAGARGTCVMSVLIGEVDRVR